jgi:hypothetical protein
MWMEAGHHDGEMTPERALRDFDSNNDSHLSWDEFWAGWEDDHDEGSHHGHHEEHHNVAVLYPDNSMAMYEAEHDALPENATGWNLTHAALTGDGNLTLNYSVHSTYGTNLIGINGTDAPDDYTWYWQLMLWNSTSTPPSWEPSQHGIDSVMIGENFSNFMGSGTSEAEHIAWAVNTSNHSLLPSQTMPDEHDAHEEHEEEMFNESDMNTDGLLNMSELGHFIEDVEKWLNPPLGFAVIHILAEGDYGFVMPADVGFHILMGEGGHDDHVGYDDHGDEHGDEHDADGDNHSVEETLNYDPHSWLSPLAFKAQVNVVMNGFTTAFPDGEDDFKANAELYAA